MIIEGAPAGNVGFWTKHLQRTDTNEEVHIREVRGTMAEDLEGALREMQAVASGSRSQGNFMYQANINPRADEHLTPEQWRQAIDTLEKNLGLEDHQRVVIEHVKEGRQHYHVIWNRVDVDTMRVRDMGGNYYTHERTARQLEEAFGLERTPRAHGDREGERVSKRTDLWEYEQGQRTGQTPKQIKEELTTLWRAAPDGQTFIEALEHHGYILAKGDRRDFCVIDRAGDEHSLSRRLDGVTARQLRERLGFVDRESLPSVDDAKALHAERQAGRMQAAEDRDGGQEQVRESANGPAMAGEPERQAAETRAAMPGAEQAAPAETHETPHRQQTDSHDDAAAATAGKEEGFGRAPVKVFDAVAGAVATLADFVADILTAFVAPPEPKRTVYEEALRDPAERVAEIKARNRADAALARMGEDLKHGSYVRAEDVRALTPADLENLRNTGDAGLLDMIRRLEEERQRERDYGRGRER